jgi:hypothetical protein
MRVHVVLPILATLTLFAGCAAPTARPALTPFPPLLSGTVGCWTLRAVPPPGFRVSEEVTVRLYPEVEWVHGGTLVFRAAGLSGVGARPGTSPRMRWVQGAPAETVKVVLPSLGPVVWRIVRHGDSLQGSLYYGNDRSFEQPRTGPASGRRVACPS